MWKVAQESTRAVPATGAQTYAVDRHCWQTGPGGFGTEITPGAIVGTTWNTGDIWLRREFNVGHEDLHNAKIQLFHDEDAEIYFNGILAAQAPRYSANYYLMNINAPAAESLKPGLNIMAVHCHQTVGGQFIDVGIVVPQAVKPAAAKK